MAGQADVFNRLQAALQSSGNMMTASQVAQLQDLLNGGGHVSPAVIAQADQFLNPEQQKALNAIRANQLANELERQQGLLPAPPATP